MALFGARTRRTPCGTTRRRRAHFRQDTHWTPLGAVIAAEALVKSFAPGTWDDREMPIDGVAAYDTDLLRLIGLPAGARAEARCATGCHGRADRRADDRRPAERPRHLALAGRPDCRGRRGSDADHHDSFFRTNEGRIAPWFRDSVWVHADDLKRSPQLVADLLAFDHVVLERVERSVYDIDIDALLAPVIAAAR